MALNVIEYGGYYHLEQTNAGTSQRDQMDIYCIKH